VVGIDMIRNDRNVAASQIYPVIVIVFVLSYIAFIYQDRRLYIIYRIYDYDHSNRA